MAETHDRQARDRGPVAGTGPARARLEERVRQKEAVAQLGAVALSCRELPPLFDEACRFVADVLAVEYSKVLELMPDGERLLLRAGVGWEKGRVGAASVGTNLQSQAGYTLVYGGPVVVENLAEESRFKGAPLLHDHGVVSGVSVPIRAGGHLFGVLGAHSCAGRVFAEHDVLFVEEVADLLGAAIERREEEDRSLEIAAELSERAEAAERRFEFLAGANALLSASSTDYATTLQNVARLAVPALADWCFVDLVEPGGNLRRAVVGHAGSGASAEVAGELKRRHPLDPNLAHGTPRVLRTGRSELLVEVDDKVLRSIATDHEHLALLRRLAPRSYMCVPLRTRRAELGAIGFVVSGESGRTYGEEDLALAEGLAHCAALALDNAASRVPEVELAREIIRLSGREAAVVSPPVGADANLTRRQLEVLGLMAEGRTARQIGRHLHISEETVRNHIRAIKTALDASSQLEAIAQARRLGVLPR